MSGEKMAPYRANLLRHAQGKVLELGFGSGLNLPFYPPTIHEIHALEVNKGMQPLARKNINRTSLPVHYHSLDAEQLPFPDNFFDTVVSTWTLCSIEHVSQALKEASRVLKPNGKFLFTEHGLSNEPRVQKWQHRLTPIQKILAEGCRLNRNIEGLIADAGFKFIELQKEYMADEPKIAGYLYIGIAAKQVFDKN